MRIHTPPRISFVFLILWIGLASKDVLAEQNCVGVNNHSKCAVEKFLRCVQQFPYEACLKQAQMPTLVAPKALGRLVRFDTRMIDTSHDTRGVMSRWSPVEAASTARVTVHEYYCRAGDRTCATTLFVSVRYSVEFDLNAKRWRVVARNFGPPFGDFPWPTARVLGASDDEAFCTPPAISPICAAVVRLRCSFDGDCYDYVHERPYRRDDPKTKPHIIEYRILDAYEYTEDYSGTWLAYKDIGDWYINIGFRHCRSVDGRRHCDVTWSSVFLHARKLEENKWSALELLRLPDPQ